MQNQRTRIRAAFGLLLPALVLLSACGGTTGPAPTPPVITTSQLPDAIQGEPYSEAIHADGGEEGYTWTQIGGQLPPGLALTVEDGAPGEALVTGTPTSLGTFDFTVRVESGGLADTAQLSITVVAPPEPVAITTPRVPPALAGAIYRVILKATGGDQVRFEWSVVSGALPAGLTLSEDGQFQGEPERADTTTFTVQVSSGGFTDRRTYTLAVVAEQDHYSITIFPVVDIPAGLQDNVREAVRRWEAALPANLPLAHIPTGTNGLQSGSCGGFGPLVNGTSVDDLVVMLNITEIDGPGQVLAQAGPCILRNTSWLPYAGLVTLDVADLREADDEEWVTDIIQHEIGHVLGFGTLWPTFELVVGTRSEDPRYVGAQAIAEYKAAGGTADSIPVEDRGGQGSKNSHWRTSVFGDELMTAFAAQPGTDMFLSRMSVASFADMGYQVNLGAADQGTLFSWMADEAAPERAGERYAGYDIVGVGPIVVFHDDGTRSILSDLHPARP